jgi:hypothetical protein
MREQVRLAEERVAALAADGQGGTAAAEAVTEDAERRA